MQYLHMYLHMCLHTCLHMYLHTVCILHTDLPPYAKHELSHNDTTKLKAALGAVPGQTLRKLSDKPGYIHTYIPMYIHI